MKRCFGYVRVSTVKQGDGVSLVAQREAISAFAIRHNIEIVQWFEEKETAAKRGRPIFDQMVKQLRRGKADGLVVHKIDRSARNFTDWAKIGDLADAGIDIHFANESLDFHSRGGRLTADIQAVIAADYIRNLREETIKGINGRLKQGLTPFAAPIGYLNNGGGKPKTPDPERAPFIRRAFELYASGHHSQKSLQRELAAQGLRTKAGRPLSLTFNERKAALLLEEAVLKERAAAAAKLPNSDHIEKFLERVKNLGNTFSFAVGAEKYEIAKIATSNRTVVGKEVYVEPDNWLIEVVQTVSALCSPPPPCTHRRGCKLPDNHTCYVAEDEALAALEKVVANPLARALLNISD